MDTTPPGASAPVHGADPDALRATALAFARTADLLELVDLRTHDGLAALTWSGQDANRVRAAWDDEHAVTLHLTAELLRTGALLLLDEADDQDATSSAGSIDTIGTADTIGAVGTAHSPAPGTAGAEGPTTWAGLRERLTGLLTTAAGTSAHVVRETSTVSTAVDAAALVGLRVRAAQSLGDAGILARVADFSVGPVTDRALGVLGVAGTAVGAYDTYVAYQEGDWWRTTDGAVSTGLSVAGMVGGGLPALGAGVAWTGGAWVGTEIYEGMQGTGYGEHFERRMEGAFDRAGAVGMLWTPVALAQAGLDSAVDAAKDAGRAYQRLYDAASSPTPWSWQTLSGEWPDEDGTGEP